MQYFVDREGTPWLAHEEDKLRALASTHSADQLGELLGRSRGGVKKHAHLLKISLRRKDRSQLVPWNGWLPEQDQRLRALIAKGLTRRECATRIMRSLRSVQDRVIKLAIEMPPDPDMRQAKAIQWNDKIERAKKLWIEGRTGLAIANDLGEPFTRSAVVAKMHRLGLRRGPKTKLHRVRKTPKTKAIRVTVGGKPALAYKTPFILRGLNEWNFASHVKPATALVPANDPATVPLEELQNRHCRWIGGDPQKIPRTEPLYCGHDRLPGLPYCAQHSARAFRVVSNAQRLTIFTDDKLKECM